MNVVVLINGREAIPVRAIPYMADSTVSPDILVRGLLCTKDDNPFHKLSAYELLEYECSRKVGAVEWRPVAVNLNALSDTLHRRELKGELTHAEATAEWKRESVKRLPPGVFVWKDKFFRQHFERYRRLSNEELAQHHRDGLEMLRDLASAPDDSYTAELMAAHGVPENWRETFQAEMDQANEEGPFNPGDYCVYVPNTCAPRETDTLSDVTFSPLITGDERLVVMDGFEYVPKAGPKSEEEESALVRAGQIARILATWFEEPIDGLPLYPRKIADLYVPRWRELSADERRAQADEADLQLQATLGDRFEKTRREVDQSHAAAPTRFAQRALQDGFDKVMREKAGEQNFEAKTSAVNLSHERCIELARKPELRIADWNDLTGIRRGKLCTYQITTEGVYFIPWDDELIRSAPTSEWDSEMSRDNEQPPLLFPCTPRDVLHFIDTARADLYGFSVPDAFRQAVSEIAPTTDTPPRVPDESQGQSDTANSGAVEKVAPEVTPDDDEQADSATPTTAHNSEPMQRQRYQEDEILRVISELGYKAEALPRWKLGKPGAKAEVRAKFPYWSGTTIFKKAWERLRADKQIREAD